MDTPRRRLIRCKSIGPLSEQEPLQTKASKQPKDDFTRGMYRKWLVEPPYNPQVLAELLEESTEFSTICRQIAIDTAGLGWHLVANDDVEKPNEAQKEIANKLFGHPNNEMTFWELCHAMCMDFESTANGYMEISRGATAQIDGLYHAPATKTRVRKDKLGFGQRYGGGDITWFRNFESDPADATSHKGEDPTGELLNEMVQHKFYHSANSYYGIPAIIPALGALRANQFIMDRNLRFFYNKGLPEWVLIIEPETDDIEDEELDAIEAEVKNHLESTLRGEHYKVLLLAPPKGVKIRLEKWSPEFKDADHRTFRLDNRDEEVRSYAIPPHRIGIIESGNLGGGTGESQTETYKNGIIKPRQEKLELIFTRIMKINGVTDWKFKFDELDSVDEQREAVIFAAISATPALSIDEMREYASKFLKMEFKPYDEPWSKVPWRLIEPQAAFLDLDLGVPMLPTSGNGGGGELPGPLSQALAILRNRQKAAEQLSAMYQKVQLGK